LRALPAEEREDLIYDDIGPGDSYVGMWRMVNYYRYRLNILDQEMRAETTPSKSREKDIRYYSEQITSIYGKLLIHEKPRLASVEVKGDPQNPVHTNVDLTGLPDEDLHALARIIPKLGGSVRHDEVSRGDLDAGLRADQAAPGRARAPAGRAKLRKAET
jgi:hypothetical protein